MRENKEMIKKNENKKIVKRVGLALVTTVICIGCASNVFATDDPLTVIDNLSTFIFSIIRAIGMILLGWRNCTNRFSIKKS